MNKIIPFNKDITFNEKIGEITSIALDDTLKFDDDYTIKGDLVVRGCHKVDEVENDFSYTIPVLISVDEKYDTTSASISIDDFYYEILNDAILKVKIDLILDNIFYKKEEVREEIINVDSNTDIESNIHDDKDILDNNFDLEKDNIEEINVDTKNVDEKKDAIDFFKPNDEVDYSIYRVYIVLPDDTLDSVLDKYKITKEELEKYNDLSNLKKGDKLIIPSVDE